MYSSEGFNRLKTRPTIYMNIALRRFLHNHGNIATEGSPKPGLYPTLISNDFNDFIVHSTIGSTVHSMSLNSLKHCICTITMTNIRPDRDSNLVPPGYKPQSIRMSHRGRPHPTMIIGLYQINNNSPFPA